MSSPRTPARKRAAEQEFPFVQRPSHLPEPQPDKPDPIQVGYLPDEFIDSLTYKQAYAWTSGLDGTVRKNASLKQRRSFLKALRDLTQRTIHRAIEGWTLPAASSSSSQSSHAPPAKRGRVDESADAEPAQHRSMPHPGEAPGPSQQQQQQQQQPVPPPQVRDRRAPPPKDSMNKIRNLHNGMNLAPMTTSTPAPAPPMGFREQMSRYYRDVDFDGRYDHDVPPRRSSGHRYRSRSRDRWSRSRDHRSRSRDRHGRWAPPVPRGHPENEGRYAPPVDFRGHYAGSYVPAAPQGSGQQFSGRGGAQPMASYAPPAISHGVQPNGIPGPAAGQGNAYHGEPSASNGVPQMNGPPIVPNNDAGPNGLPMQQPQPPRPCYSQQDRQQELHQQNNGACPPTPAGQGGAPSTSSGSMPSSSA